MEALEGSIGTVTLRMSQAEAVVLHEAIARAEFANDLGEIELQPVEQKVFSAVQQTLAPLIAGLGTDGYQGTLDRAYTAIDPKM
ncbi:hypothetical protein Ais01nite_54820 [Asanoa ishikariensis]|uniref:Uncharacterized protein n=1 Tax=Asanoa ishikariensis TaxID=137265 RepID=A0A1H3TTW5_9ACTN|nr:hypothetical protein [Asanoa ishikariensis]GIF67447.1 hypothetical protein Ais01nite_54820 [Asanoa ishikariensis]SDZ53408.1 hypothetical protein SAMN05421684_6343 [Asanoa ishikariensis]